MYRTFFKPLLDFCVAFSAIVVLSPLILVISVLLALANKGNPFFIQARPGKNEKLFRIFKFRTMSNACDSFGNLLPDAERITIIGKFVRSTSIDEIPQLLNVLKGDMSLIGPRPLLPEYLPLYNHWQKKRHLVRPGITGWAQVNGRNAIDWDQKFRMDAYYVENVNWKLDLKIIVQTFKKVIASEGINSEGQVTTQKFKGNL